jgi:hypothetical protein
MRHARGDAETRIAWHPRGAYIFVKIKDAAPRLLRYDCKGEEQC